MAYKYLNEDGAKELAKKAKEYSNKVKVQFGKTTYSQDAGQLITIPKPTFSDITGEDLNGYAKTLKFSSSVAWSSNLTYSAVSHVITLPTSGWGISITGSAGKVANKLTIGSKQYDGSSAVSVVKGDIGLGNVQNYGQTKDYTSVSDSDKNLYFTHEGAGNLYTALNNKITKIGEDLSGVAKGYVISVAKTSYSDGKYSYTVLNGKLNTTDENVAVVCTAGTYPAFILSDGKTVLDPGTLKVGDTIYIIENNIPDRWITSITVSSDLKTTTINFARLESDNRNIYAHCVEGNQDKVKYAQSADNADKLDNHDSTYFATASSVTTLQGTVNANKSNIAKNASEIASIKSDYVKYESATKSIYRDGFGIYSGTKGGTVGGKTGFQISGDTIQVYDNLNVSSPKRSTLESGYVEVSETGVVVGQGSVSNTMRMTSTGFLFNSVYVAMPAVTERTTLLVASDFTAISTDTIDGWF